MQLQGVKLRVVVIHSSLVKYFANGLRRPGTYQIRGRLICTQSYSSVQRAIVRLARQTWTSFLVAGANDLCAAEFWKASGSDDITATAEPGIAS